MTNIVFGTDGIRGVVGVFPITNDVFNRLGQTCCQWLMQQQMPLTVAMGCDTRASGPQLAQSFAEGFCSYHPQAQVIWLGVIPTPAISFYVQKESISLGVSITASHNPFIDNGLKLFKSTGSKLKREEEIQLEQWVQDKQPKSSEIRCQKISGQDYFLRALKQNYPLPVLKGKVIVLDTANGATTYTTLPLLKSLGADVIAIGDQPNGENINCLCGSEYAKLLTTVVENEQAWLGFAHDGDGDRLVVIDEEGKLLDGDEVLGILALDLHEKNLLKPSLIVVTEQSNSGLAKTLKPLGIDVVVCGIGDREVFYKLEETQGILGGESSGHIVLKQEAPTGDGLRVLLKLLQLAEEKPLCERRKAITLLPKLESFLKVDEKKPLEQLVGLNKVVKDLSNEDIRVCVRYSGTENKLRFLVEAASLDLCRTYMEMLKTSAVKDLQF